MVASDHVTDDSRLEAFRSARLGPRIPAFTSSSDPAVLLSAVAEALNTCERHGLIVDLERDGALTSRGYVLPVGDGRLGSRWQVRQRLEMAPEPCLDVGED